MTLSDPDTARIRSCVHLIIYLLTTSYLRRVQEPGETTGSCDATANDGTLSPYAAATPDLEQYISIRVEMEEMLCRACIPPFVYSKTVLRLDIYKCVSNGPNQILTR
jgi:hypothetical protein